MQPVQAPASDAAEGQKAVAADVAAQFMAEQQHTIQADDSGGSDSDPAGGFSANCPLNRVTLPLVHENLSSV